MNPTADLSANVSVVPCTDAAEWDRAVNADGGHPLQLWGWGETKAAYEWTAERLVLSDDQGPVGSAQVLIRHLPVPFRSLAYIPRGPQAAPERAAEVLTALAGYIKARHGSVALSVEPDWDEDQPDWTAALQAAGFRRSGNTGLIPSTLIVDLTLPEDERMAQLSKTTRQNVRKSLKAENVEFRPIQTDAELEAVLAINRETARRAGFSVHSDDYHHRIRRNLQDASPVLAAFEGPDLLAFVWLAVSDRTAFELYGGVNARGQKLRVNYGLKWYAMQQMAERGVQRYDFNGLLNDGISDFKRQFAKHENLLVGTWDKPLSPLYPIFATVLPLVRRSLKKAAGLGRRISGR